MSHPKATTKTPPQNDKIRKINVWPINIKIRSANPEIPQQFLKPLDKTPLSRTIDISDFSRLKDIKQANGKTKLVQAIVAHSCCERLAFLVKFVDNSTNWLDVELVGQLEPKHIFDDFLRKVYLFHSKIWSWIERRAKENNYNISVHLTAECIDKRIEDRRRRNAYSHRASAKKLKSC